MSNALIVIITIIL